MVINIQDYKEKIENGISKQEYMEQVETQNTPSVNQEGKDKLFSRILNKLDSIVVTVQTLDRVSPKLPIRKFKQVKDMRCPYCHTKNVGWLDEDFYPDGVDAYMASRVPGLEEYINKPYHFKYPEQEILQCVKCGKVVDLYGSMLECAEKIAASKGEEYEDY
ncbi:MAG: hypothetical protein J6B50_03925 [Lachnospiraceae bacterium]|nr:hypothetical protein [Lachnospiraceae bacterium]